MAATINASSSSGIVTTADNSAQLELQTASTTRLTIDSSGNVGIGTTAPTTKLTISNNTALPSAGAITGTGLWQVGADATANNILLDSFAATASFNGRRAAGTAASPTALGGSGTITGLFGYGYGTTGYSSAARVGINLMSNEAWSDTAQGTRITFSTTANTTTTTSEKMRIDDAGNVGIGTTSPSTWGKFAVVGASSGGQVVAAIANTSGTANTQAVLSFDTTNNGFNVRDSQIRATNNGGNLTTLEFYTSNSATPTEKMRIDSSGNVGIGNTPSGTYKLQVSGLISDSKGDVRAAPIQSKTSAYVLTATDAGQTISITTGGVTVNASVFSAGDMVSIFNNSGTAQTITQGASVTLRLSGTATTGSRTLAQYGVATLLCVVGGATPTFACTGAGLT